MPRHISKRMRRLSHSPKAKAKRARTMAAILAYRKEKGIPLHQKLTAKQKRAAKFARPGIYIPENVERGSMPLGNIGPRPRAKSGAKRTYVTTKRVDLASDIVATVKALRGSSNPENVATFLHVLKAILNGAAH